MLLLLVSATSSSSGCLMSSDDLDVTLTKVVQLVEISPKKLHSSKNF